MVTRVHFKQGLKSSSWKPLATESIKPIHYKDVSSTVLDVTRLTITRKCSFAVLTNKPQDDLPVQATPCKGRSLHNPPNLQGWNEYHL